MRVKNIPDETPPRGATQDDHGGPADDTSALTHCLTSESVLWPQDDFKLRESGLSQQRCLLFPDS